MKKGNGRVKGHSYEREIAVLLRRVFPDAKRELEYQEGIGHDISDTGIFRFQCKRGRKWAPISKIKEIKVPGIHCLVTRGDRERDVVCMYLDDFMDLLEAYAKKEKTI